MTALARSIVPVLLAAWRDKGLLVRTLDDLVGRTLAPMIVAFVEPARPDRALRALFLPG